FRSTVKARPSWPTFDGLLESMGEYRFMSGVLPQATQLTLPVAPCRAEAPPAAINAATTSSPRAAFPLPLAFMSLLEDSARLDASQERHGVRGEAFAAAGVAEPVRRRRPDVDLAAGEGVLEPDPHRFAVR